MLQVFVKIFELKFITGTLQNNVLVNIVNIETNKTFLLNNKTYTSIYNMYVICQLNVSSFQCISGWSDQGGIKYLLFNNSGIIYIP